MNPHRQNQGGRQRTHSASTTPPRQVLKKSDGESESSAEGSIIIPGNKSFPAPVSLQHVPGLHLLPRRARLPGQLPSQTAPAVTGAFETELPGGSPPHSSYQSPGQWAAPAAPAPGCTGTAGRAAFRNNGLAACGRAAHSFRERSHRGPRKLRDPGSALLDRHAAHKASRAPGSPARTG